MVVAVKVGSMTRRTLATTGYCTWLQAAIGVMTLLTGSAAGSAGTVMDCRYDITCMTTNTVNRRAARIAVNQDVTEARIRMINWGVVMPAGVDRDMTVVTVLGPTGNTHINNKLRGGGVAHIRRILMTDHAIVAGNTLGMGLQTLDYRVACRMTVITR